MRKSVIAIIIIVLVVLYMSVFVVKEGERGITLRFGKVLRDDDNKPLVYEPGLHFKIPFIETVKMLDARIQTMDNQADRFVTKEKKDLIVDSYIKWRISDFSRYYLATGGGKWLKGRTACPCVFARKHPWMAWLRSGGWILMRSTPWCG